MSEQSEEIKKKIFDIHSEPRNNGAWWWWFWLFFFDNPENPEKPKQLMILWSTKFDPKLSCNGAEMKLDHSIGQETDMEKFDGAVAAWYYDGKKMHHNYLLEQCILHNNGEQVISESTPKTEFTSESETFTVKIGNHMTFNAQIRENNSFTEPKYSESDFLGNQFNYKIMRMNKLNLTGEVDGIHIKGTAYFQRLFVNAPVIPWYWGIFHFSKGSILTYFKPNLGKYLGEKAAKKYVTFYHAGEIHDFRDIHIKKIDKEHPLFQVYGKNATHDISFVVSTYEKSEWEFKKKLFNIGPKSKFRYREYPAMVKKIELVNRKTDIKITETDTGIAIGNAEYSTGLMI